LPKLEAGLSDLVAFGEMGFSGRMPTGKAGAETAALIAELRAIGFLPAQVNNTANVDTASVNTKYIKTGAGR
jgi:chromosome partitioning protein